MNLNKPCNIENDDILQELKYKHVQKLENTLLDDLMPNENIQFPIEKVTKLIQKDYDQLKFKYDMDRDLKAMNYEEGSKRVE